MIVPDTTGVAMVTARSDRYPNVLLAVMLLALHFSVAWGNESWWERGLMLAHLGLFLIWQPVWSGERQVPAAVAVIMLSLGAIFSFIGNWWMIGVWLASLFGLIGGSVPGRAVHRDRLVSMLAAIYLVTMLLLCVVPQVFVNYQPLTGTTYFVRYGMLILPLVILAIPGSERGRSEPVVVDLFYSMMLFLLVGVLALGSFVVHELTRGEYLLGLAQTLVVIAVVLAALSWLWNPRAGFGGIGTLLSQYLLGLGLPFEHRMQRLAELAQAETRPEQFLRNAMAYLLEVPWIAGFSWTSPQSVGELGETSGHAEWIVVRELRITLYAPQPFSPAVLLHLKLLMQMAGYFYEALRQEQQRRQSAYSQAIYETGARLTHDVKNLLQSLRIICSAAEMHGVGNDLKFRSLVQRQLPHIAERLETTLEKLKSPTATDNKVIDARIWWQALQSRYVGRAVDFQHTELPDGISLPVELFDSIAETLIENALFKVTQDAAVQVTVGLDTGSRLTVVDTGPPVSATLTQEIFRAPVASDSGLGVGLFQAARFAEQSGYRLTLTENRDGAVSFELGPAA